jgi:MoxR-like ATPase
MSNLIGKIVGPDKMYPVRTNTTVCKDGAKVNLKLDTFPSDPEAILVKINGEELGYIANKSYTAKSTTKAKDIYPLIKDEHEATLRIIDGEFYVEIAISEEGESKIYNVIGTGSKAQCPARFAPSKELRAGKKVPLNIVKSGVGYCFRYNSELCALIAPENSPEYKAAVNEKVQNLLSKEKINELLEDIDISNVSCYITKLNANSTYLIEVQVSDENSVALEEAEKATFDDLLEGESESRKDAILSRVGFIKNNTTVSDDLIIKFVQRLIRHEGEFKPFEPKYKNDKSKRILDRAFEGILFGMNLRLVGPPGCGKNVLAEDLVNLFDVEISDMPMSISTDLDQLLGQTSILPSIKKEIEKEEVAAAISGLRGGNIDENALKKLIDYLAPVVPETAFTPSEMIAKNEVGPTATILDEANMAMANILSVLHSACDGRRYINVPGYKTIQLHDESFFIITMNEELEGTRPLNAAFKDRFATIRFERSNSIADIIKTNVPTIKAKDIKVLQSLYEKIAKNIGPSLSEDSFSIRSFIRAATKIANGVNPKYAIMDTIVEEIDDSSDRNSVKELVDLMIK